MFAVDASQGGLAGGGRLVQVAADRQLGRRRTATPLLFAAAAAALVAGRLRRRARHHAVVLLQTAAKRPPKTATKERNKKTNKAVLVSDGLSCPDRFEWQKSTLFRFSRVLRRVGARNQDSSTNELKFDSRLAVNSTEAAEVSIGVGSSGQNFWCLFFRAILGDKLLTFEAISWFKIRAITLCGCTGNSIDSIAEDRIKVFCSF